jgi:GTPase SAR1 family protein
MASLNIAVIGAMGVGKSGFIERVMGLSRPPLSNASQARRVVDGVAYLVTVLELDLEHFELDSKQPIQWPRQINGHIIPHVDGALIIYDVTAYDSLKDLPATLGA